MDKKKKSIIKVILFVIAINIYFYFAMDYQKSIEEGEKAYDAGVEKYIDSINRFDSVKIFERNK